MSDDDFKALSARYFLARTVFNAAYAKFEPIRSAYFAELARRYHAASDATRKVMP